MCDGQVAVNRVDGLLDSSRDGSEVARVADFEVAEHPRVLTVRDVIEIYGFFRKITELNILRYADHGDIVFGLVIAQAIVAPDRVAEGKQGLRARA